MVTPLQNRGQAARNKSGKNIEEKQSKATSTARRVQTVSNESLEHLTGVSKGISSKVYRLNKSVEKTTMNKWAHLISCCRSWSMHKTNELRRIKPDI